MLIWILFVASICLNEALEAAGKQYKRKAMPARFIDYLNPAGIRRIKKFAALAVSIWFPGQATTFQRST
jgi:hypothetical protein